MDFFSIPLHPHDAIPANGCYVSLAPAESMTYEEILDESPTAEMVLALVTPYYRGEPLWPLEAQKRFAFHLSRWQMIEEAKKAIAYAHAWERVQGGTSYDWMTHWESLI